MTAIVQRIVARHITPAGMETSLTIVDATIVNGIPLQANFAVDWNAVTPVPFHARFAGHLVPVANPDATFSQNVPAAIASSVAAHNAANPSLDPLTVSASDDRRVEFPADFVGPFLLSRGTLEFAEVAADETIGWRATFVSLGSQTTATADAVVSHAGSGSPGVGVLHHLTFSQDWADVNMPAGVICEVLGWDEDDDPVPLAGGLIFVGTGLHTGKVAIRTTGSGASTHQFIDAVGVSAPLDFESAVQPVRVRSYTVGVQGTDGAATAVQGSLKLRPRETIPAGITTTATEETVSTVAAFYAAVRQHRNDHKIIVDPTLPPAVWEPPDTNALVFSGSNQIYVFPPQIAFMNGRAWLQRQGDDVVMDGGALMVGQAFVNLGPPALKLIDAAQAGFQMTDWLRRYVVKRFFFGGSNDETFSTMSLNGSYAPRGVHFTQCVSAYAFYNAGHPNGPQHNHGPNVGFNPANVAITKSLLKDLDTRYPLVKNAFSVLDANNIKFNWKTYPAGATRFVADTLSATQPQCTVRSEANLYVAGPDSVNPVRPGRAGAVRCFRLHENAADIYAPETSHYVNPVTDTFALDPVTVANGGIALDECSGPGVLKSTPPFEVTGITITALPDETAIRDLWDDILDNCGNGGQLCQDIIAEARAGTRRTDTTPAQFAALYGPPPYTAGGTIPHGIVA